MAVKMLPEMSKQEEVAHFNKFFDKLPEDSYLRMMLDGMKARVSGDIESDWGRNIMESLEYWTREARTWNLKYEKAANLAQAAEAEVMVLKEAAENDADTIALLMQENARLRERMERISGALRVLREVE